MRHELSIDYLSSPPSFLVINHDILFLKLLLDLFIRVYHSTPLIFLRILCDLLFIIYAVFVKCSFDGLRALPYLKSEVVVLIIVNARSVWSYNYRVHGGTCFHIFLLAPRSSTPTFLFSWDICI